MEQENALRSQPPLLLEEEHTQVGSRPLFIFFEKLQIIFFVSSNPNSSFIRPQHEMRLDHATSQCAIIFPWIVRGCIRELGTKVQRTQGLFSPKIPIAHAASPTCPGLSHSYSETLNFGSRWRLH